MLLHFAFVVLTRPCQSGCVKITARVSLDKTLTSERLFQMVRDRASCLWRSWRSSLCFSILGPQTACLGTGSPHTERWGENPPRSLICLFTDQCLGKKAKGKNGYSRSFLKLRFSFVIHLLTLLSMISVFPYVDCWTFYKAIHPSSGNR